MNYAIIENKKEKLYWVEDCCEPDYWYLHNEDIQHYLHDYSLTVYMLDSSAEENERIKKDFLDNFQENGYQSKMLTNYIIGKRSEVNRAKEQARKKRR